MKKLAVIVFHGIGTYWRRGGEVSEDFDKPLREAMEKRLGKDFEQVAWRRVVWSDPKLEARQAALLDDRAPPRAWRWLFEFTAAGLGDASAYNLPTGGADSGAYHTVQHNVRRQLALLEAELGDAAAATPVLAIAHSLGCHVLSCYAWDAIHNTKPIFGDDALSAFQSLATLSGLIFYGCNLPLVTMNVERTALMPMKLPLQPAALGGKESAWLNFFEGSDPLGYQIADEYKAYFEGGFTGGDPARWGRDPKAERRPVDQEVTMFSLPGLTPIAHSRYDRSRTVLNAVEAEIRRLLG